MDMEQDQNEVKLPMYYERINELMKIVSKTYLTGSLRGYVKSFRQLYSLVRSELSKNKKEYYDTKINELGFPSSSDMYYSLQLELYQDLEECGIFKVLKQNIEELELM